MEADVAVAVAVAVAVDGRVTEADGCGDESNFSSLF